MNMLKVIGLLCAASVLTLQSMHEERYQYQLTAGEVNPISKLVRECAVKLSSMAAFAAQRAEVDKSSAEASKEKAYLILYRYREKIGKLIKEDDWKVRRWGGNGHREALLVNKPSKDECGLTPLMEICRFGLKSLIRSVLCMRADLSIINNAGENIIEDLESFSPFGPGFEVEKGGFAQCRKLIKERDYSTKHNRARNRRGRRHIKRNWLVDLSKQLNTELDKEIQRERAWAAEQDRLLYRAALRDARERALVPWFAEQEAREVIKKEAEEKKRRELELEQEYEQS